MNSQEIEALVGELQKPLPVCPYDRRSPDYWIAPDDKPCVVCGSVNEEGAPDLCRGADTRVMDRAAAALTALVGERDGLAEKVFVPGVRRCAKCGLRLVSATLRAGDGSVTANNDPQPCPNGCGPLWPVTEREAGNDLCDRLDAAADHLTEALRQRDEAREALRPFAKIEPSSLYPEDGSEAERYVVRLHDGSRHSGPHDFTGTDLARALAALGDPS